MKRNMLMYATLFGALVTTSLGLVGCAHSAHTRGSVALKHSAKEADVCLGKGEVKLGDKVALFKNVCKPRIRSKGELDMASSCTKIKLGEGRVSQVIDEHYSTIQVDSDLSFTEGTIVEKL